MKDCHIIEVTASQCVSLTLILIQRVIRNDCRRIGPSWTLNPFTRACLQVWKPTQNSGATWWEDWKTFRSFAVAPPGDYNMISMCTSIYYGEGGGVLNMNSNGNAIWWLHGKHYNLQERLPRHTCVRVGRWKLLAGGGAHFWGSGPFRATWCHRHHLLGGSGDMPSQNFWKQRLHFLQLRHSTGHLKWLFKSFYLSWIEWVLSIQVQCRRVIDKRWVIIHSNKYKIYILTVFSVLMCLCPLVIRCKLCEMTKEFPPSVVCTCNSSAV